MNAENLKYVLITAAHNEADFIEKVIISVINQKHRPAEWIIVSDNSTDQTEEIVSKYLTEHNYIKLIINKREEGYDFTSKVFALNLGINKLKTMDYNFIGILDADVSFNPEFYSTLIAEFNKNKLLGIAGGEYFDIVKGKKQYVKPSPYSVRGATQFFKRECFEQIDGIKPMKYGGEDALACYTARMYGWEIKNVNNLIVLHLKPTGMTNGNITRTRFREGMADYGLGYYPAFFMTKCIKRILEKPFLVGSTLRLLGYSFHFISNNKINLSRDLLNFIRTDQKNRLKIFMKDKQHLLK